MPAGFCKRIECALDVHDEAAAVREQTRDQRPTRRPIRVMRHRKDDGVGGCRIVLQGETVFPQRRCVIGERIVNLHG